MRNLSKKTMKHLVKRALFQMDPYNPIIFTKYELMIMVDALERYASECEKRMKESDMAMEREYYKRRMESANEAYNKALKEI